MFKETFYMFIGHYKQRINTDAPWFLPSRENLPSIQSIVEYVENHPKTLIEMFSVSLFLFSAICTLLQLKICSNENLLRIHLEETIKQRIRTDIHDSFSVHEFVFNDKQDIQLPKILTFVEFVTKLTQSMSVIHEYQKLFTIFNVNYMKICFFETSSAADRVKSKCLEIVRLCLSVDISAVRIE